MRGVRSFSCLPLVGVEVGTLVRPQLRPRVAEGLCDAHVRDRVARPCTAVAMWAASLREQRPGSWVAPLVAQLVHWNPGRSLGLASGLEELVHAQEHVPPLRGVAARARRVHLLPSEAAGLQASANTIRFREIHLELVARLDAVLDGIVGQLGVALGRGANAVGAVVADGEHDTPLPLPLAPLLLLGPWPAQSVTDAFWVGRMPSPSVVSRMPRQQMHRGSNYGGDEPLRPSLFEGARAIEQ